MFESIPPYLITWTKKNFFNGVRFYIKRNPIKWLYIKWKISAETMGRLYGKCRGFVMEGVMRFVNDPSDQQAEKQEVCLQS